MASDVLALPALPDDEPAGPNLEFDAQFSELDRAAKGKEEVQYGSTIEAAVPPEWKEVEALALALLARTRDLRVMTHLAIARLHLAGIPAFAEVLTGIRSLLEAQWDKVHPQLDPEDDLDPMLRANALAKLRDPLRVLRTLRDLPLAGSARTGPVTWRDIAISSGSLEPEPGKEKDKKTEAVIRGAFAETDPARRRTMREGMERGIAESAAISAAFDKQAGIGAGPDLTDLGKLLRDMLKEVVRYSPPDAAEVAEAPADGPVAGEAGTASAAPAPAAAATPGFASIKAITAVHRRDEVLHLLDLVLAYYREHEPSSPLPLLVERARRLAPLGFMDVLRDLAPDGVSQAQVVAGPDASASASE